MAVFQFMPQAARGCVTQGIDSKSNQPESAKPPPAGSWRSCRGIGAKTGQKANLLPLRAD
jgi:hypothetical protein